jgi:hypothetical protein
MPAHEDLPQCEVVHRVSDVEGVCDDGLLYNKGASLKAVLTKLTNLRKAYIDKVASFELIQREIDKGRVIPARIAWDPNGDLYEDGAHFVVIAGYRDPGGLREVHIYDPAAGSFLVPHLNASDEWLPYAAFVDHYQLTGRWVGTYLLKGAS